MNKISRWMKHVHRLSPCHPQACAPLWSQECGAYVFSTGICASVTNDMEPKDVIAPTAKSKMSIRQTKQRHDCDVSDRSYRLCVGMQ